MLTMPRSRLSESDPVSHPTATPATGVPTTGALATGEIDKRLTDFLLDFGVAVQKHAIYPAGHPQLTAAVERVMKRLDAAMANNRSISMGIARTQVVIEGVATDPNNSLMKELAQRFHRHRLGWITISPEVLRDELADFLVASSKDENEGPQIALAAQTERWPHIAPHLGGVRQARAHGGGRERAHDRRGETGRREADLDRRSRAPRSCSARAAPPTTCSTRWRSRAR